MMSMQPNSTAYDLGKIKGGISMAKYSYELINGGFKIIVNTSGKAIINQPFSPIDGRMYNPNEAEKIAKYVCYKMEQGEPFTLSEEEECTIIHNEPSVSLYKELLEKEALKKELQRANSQEALLKQISDTLDLLLLQQIKNNQ